MCYEQDLRSTELPSHTLSLFHVVLTIQLIDCCISDDTSTSFITLLYRPINNCIISTADGFQ